MEEKRRFTRIACNNKAVVVINNALIIDVNILNISLNGALFESTNEFIFRNEDKWQLTFKLPNSDINLQFETEVVHSSGNRVGVKFIHMGLDTMIHLRSLLEARTSKPQEIANELAFLT